MGIRQQWRRASEVMAQERDERSELANLRIARDVLVAVIVTVLAITFGLVLAPLSDHDRALGLPLIILGMIVVGGITYRVSYRRNRPYSREYERAESFKGMVLWLPLALLSSVVIVLLLTRLFGEPWLSALPVCIGVVIGMAFNITIQYRRYRRPIDQ
jgi:drug/metabolite transporter (DMT)-like permease